MCVCVCVCGRELLQFKTVHLSALGGGGGREGELPDVTYYKICNKSITPKNSYLLGTATVFTFTDSESRKHMEFYHKLMDSKVLTSLSLQWGIVSQFIHG